MSSRMPFHIFVVDDEPVIASSLTAILRLNGFSAQYFTTPLDALAALRLNKPDLLVSDVAMPGISGIELAIQVRALYPSCKVLLFSGHAATVDLLANACTKGHDFRVLQKPVHPRVMLTKICALEQENDDIASYAEAAAAQSITPLT